ncbi:Ubiquitin-40S ribosomal protein S27a [Histomonas meleagridis]|uniref:Ubiquitin-40S ribosomal protein S27a n=1 Tax=Histomonas meleagridis TaxID=135588 RepID=UPI0035599CF8|nr:Ubiquitin-40S ribosomal protein S27a [Histomonas meleagridis]KAH0800603.1 Ubiquitin-40S ribosomal protein S27a [Histomonas meleagridis]
MRLFVKTNEGKQICLNVESSSSVEEIKSMIHTDGFLVFAGQELENEFTLQDYEIEEDSILYDIPECDGGKKKKRKKKSFTTKKRVPHTRKKEKMKLLKLFKIGKDGSVEPQRKECENCKGCFMAKHKDGRLYCGNCHLTITK